MVRGTGQAAPTGRCSAHLPADYVLCSVRDPHLHPSVDRAPATRPNRLAGSVCRRPCTAVAALGARPLRRGACRMRMRCHRPTGRCCPPAVDGTRCIGSESCRVDGDRWGSHPGSGHLLRSARPTERLSAASIPGATNALLFLTLGLNHFRLRRERRSMPLAVFLRASTLMSTLMCTG